MLASTAPLFIRKKISKYQRVSGGYFEKKVFAMEKRIWSLTLLCLVLSDVGAIQVNIPESLYEFARGDNMTLPCSFTPNSPITPNQLVIITWSALSLDADPELIFTYYNTEKNVDISPIYEGRASPDVDVLQGKANLKLSFLTLADNKTYECQIQIPGDKTGKPVDTARVMVLVAPSPPICEIQGTAEYGQDITLTCVSKEGSPAPTYKWDRRNVQNIPVPQDPKTTDRGGILSLYNITKDASGYYICTSANKIRSATCNLTLSVMPPSMKIGSTAGIIGGAVAVLILLAIIIFCCCCRKKKNDKEDYAMEDHEEYTDKQVDRPGESQPLEGQETDRRYEDSKVKRTDRYEERSERDRRDYDDHRSDYDDRRSRDYDDRRSDYDDRRPRDYDDRRSDYDDRRSDYSDRRPRDYDDDRRYQDRRRDDAGDRERPPVPNSKPPRRDYD